MTHHSPKTKIRTLDMLVLDEVFEMGAGYVLNFSDKTFGVFFREELGINIDNPCYSAEGGSKAKRLRYFLRQADRSQALRTLTALWEYRVVSKLKDDGDALSPKIEKAFFDIVLRLGGERPDASDAVATATVTAQQNVDSQIVTGLKVRLLDVSKMPPHPRGIAFERFLKDMFDAYGLGGRPSFRLHGEQIDGSFVLAGQTYLLEAKWTNDKVDAATLRAFNAKVEDKAK